MKRYLVAVYAALLATLSPLAQCAPQTGWYWNPAESGRGFNIEIQGTTLFMAGFMYDANGHPMWIVSGGPMSSATTYSGTAYVTDNGQPLGGAYSNPTSVPFGNASVAFSSDTDAVVNINGYAFSITRDWFGVPAPTPAPTGSAEGMWEGSTSTGETIIGIV